MAGFFSVFSVSNGFAGDCTAVCLIWNGIARDLVFEIGRWRIFNCEEEALWANEENLLVYRPVKATVEHGDRPRRRREPESMVNEFQK